MWASALRPPPASSFCAITFVLTTWSYFSLSEHSSTHAGWCALQQVRKGKKRKKRNSGIFKNHKRAIRLAEKWNKTSKLSVESCSPSFAAILQRNQRPPLPSLQSVHGFSGSHSMWAGEVSAGEATEAPWVMVLCKFPPPHTYLIDFVRVLLNHQYWEPSVEPAKEGIKSTTFCSYIHLRGREEKKKSSQPSD